MSTRDRSVSRGTKDSAYDLKRFSKPVFLQTAEDREERLHEWLSYTQIEDMANLIKKMPGQTLSYEGLRDVLRKRYSIEFHDQQYHTLFLKINQNRDFECDFNEFISYLIFGFQQNDPSHQKEALTMPINLPPVQKKSDHKTPVISITQQKDLEISSSGESKGSYITASKEGQVKFWSKTWDPLRQELSDSYNFKKRTYILKMQSLSDVNVLCTSSADWELRFYDIANFNLRIIIRTMPFTVFAFSYGFSSETTSKLLLGDYDGNVRLLEFSPYLRGPFQSKPGTALVYLTWSEVMKGKYPTFKPKEFMAQHKTIITQTYYSLKYDWAYSSAEYRDTKRFRKFPGLVIHDVKENNKTVFNIPLGVSTFYVDEINRTLVTGGPDTFVRIWDPLIPSKPTAILTGHHGGIVLIFVQPEEKKIYSLDYLKIIKVWHLNEHNLLQNYGELVRLFQYENRLAYYYSPDWRELVVAGRQIVALKCSAKIRLDLTDGHTHAAPVSVVLYNKLFRNVVTCGLDSYIIVWDPFTGKRQLLMKNCHTKIIYGEVVDIEITCGCFDTMNQLLLTGARDGSIKVWNYNNAVCIRNLNIEENCEITSVCWVQDRILAAGWNKHVAEFADVEGQEYSDAKNWQNFHDEDITCSDVKIGEGVVTGTYSGELILWKLETGQPYRKYNVKHPKQFLEILKEKTVEEIEKVKVSSIRVSRLIRKSISHKMAADRANRDNEYTVRPSLKNLRSSTEYLEDQYCPPISIQSVLFLQTRPMTKVHGSLFVALDNGSIQVYSHHKLGGFITEFMAIHKTGDCVQCMTTDMENQYLFTGSAFGYVKIFLLNNYCIPVEEHQHICYPKLRLQFIFLLKDRFPGRAKRVAFQDKNCPMLLSCYKGHTRAINSIEYINETKYLVTGSHDCSCRLWSLGGRYLGTLGTPLPWLKLNPFQPIDEDESYRLPPDIKRMASSTTLKVLTGVYVDTVKQYQDQQRRKGKDEKGDARTSLLPVKACREMKPFPEPILGNHFQLPKRS